jgi:hypothetical protein
VEAKVDVMYVLTGERERAMPPDLSEAERDLLKRYSELPPKLRKFVDQAAFLASIAYQERPDYDYGLDHQKGARITFAGVVKAKTVAGRDMTINAPAKKPKR